MVCLEKWRRNVTKNIHLVSIALSLKDSSDWMWCIWCIGYRHQIKTNILQKVKQNWSLSLIFIADPQKIKRGEIDLSNIYKKRIMMTFHHIQYDTMILTRLCLISFHHMIKLYDSYKINLIFVSSVKVSQLCIFTFDLPSKKKKKKKVQNPCRSWLFVLKLWRGTSKVKQQRPESGNT